MSNDLRLENFLALAQAVEWGDVRCEFELVREAPAPTLVSNVNIVPYEDECWIVLRMEDGSYEVPGGTIEPGETYLDAMHRELGEEAGARLLSFEPIGVWRCRSRAAQPFRPHIPHPVFYRLVVCGKVQVVGAPSNVSERVASVERVTLEEAKRRFLAQDRADLAALYELAAAVRNGIR